MSEVRKQMSEDSGQIVACDEHLSACAQVEGSRVGGRLTSIKHLEKIRNPKSESQMIKTLNRKRSLA